MGWVTGLSAMDLWLETILWLCFKPAKRKKDEILDQWPSCVALECLRQRWVRQHGTAEHCHGPAIKNRPHVPSAISLCLSPPPGTHQSSRREKTDNFRIGQQREVDKMTVGKLHHWQPGSDWRQQTLRRQENWKMAFTRIRIDNEEDPSWQQLGAKAVTEQRQEGCSELIVFLGHFKVAWRQPSQGWQLAGRVWYGHLPSLSSLCKC